MRRRRDPLDLFRAGIIIDGKGETSETFAPQGESSR